MDVKNIYNNSMPIPREWEGRQNITMENSWDLLQQLGFRKCPEVVPVAEGYTRLGISLVEGDGEWGVWEYNDRLTSEIEAEQHAAYVAKCTPYFPLAAVYRVALRRNFGENAETNQEVTQASAMAYFAAKVASETITPLETADSALLMAAFPILAALTPDGTTWSFPWAEVPQ